MCYINPSPTHYSCITYMYNTMPTHRLYGHRWILYYKKWILRDLWCQLLPIIVRVHTQCRCRSYAFFDGTTISIIQCAVLQKCIFHFCVETRKTHTQACRIELDEIRNRKIACDYEAVVM